MLKISEMKNTIRSRGLSALVGLLLLLEGDCQRPDESQLASQALNRFAVNIFALTAEELGAVGTNGVNLALSPYTVWSLLTIIAEGARENTATEMDTALQLPINKHPFRSSYVALKNSLQGISGRYSDVNLELTSDVFTRKPHKLNATYENLVRNIYGVTAHAVNFENTGSAAATINDVVARATQNKVQNFIKPEDLRNADIILTSTLYFKGMWSIPFNKSATINQTFYNEAGTPIGEVPMMYQVAYYPYTLISELNSFVVELPYGKDSKDNKVSMIVMLPRQGERLTNVLHKLARSSITEVIRKLDESAQMFEDENVRVYLPKFHVHSDLTLNGVLQRMGIREVFQEENANLLGMFPNLLYLTRIFQKADITVDEDGTVASSAAGGMFSYKAPPPKFIANRPFAYFIVDKSSGSSIFMGTVINPLDI